MRHHKFDHWIGDDVRRASSYPDGNTGDNDRVSLGSRGGLRRKLLLLLVITLVLAATAREFIHKPGEEVPFIDVVEVQRAPLIVTARGSGYIMMPYKTDLIFKSGGLTTELWTVSEIYVDEGNRVKKEQKLAKLSTGGLERKVTLAQDVVNASQIKLQDALDKYDMSYVADAVAEIRNAVFSFTHALATHFINTISPAVGRNILASEKETLATEAPRGPLTCIVEYVDSYHQTLNKVFKEGDKIRRAVDNYVDIVEKRRAPDEIYEVAQCRAELTRALNDLKDAEGKLKDATLKAPFDGVIDEIMDIKEGDRIPANAPIMRIIDPTKVDLEAKVDEVDIFMIREGQRANIFLDALPTLEFHGKVRSIPFVSEREAGVVTYLVDIDVEPPPPVIQLREGLSAIAEIVILEKEGCLLVPIRAIKLTEEGKKVVKVAVDGEVEQRIVTTGLTDGQRIEILEGLAEGEQVVLND